MKARIRTGSRLALGVAAALWLGLATGAAAHTGVPVGDYLVEVGWRDEPAFVGQPNAVQVMVRSHGDGAPILRGVALEVVVETAGQSTSGLVLSPAFDAAAGTGSLGEYLAAIIPTAPGDYTFHVSGTIADTAVDLDLTSGEETFDAVRGSGNVEFPIRLPDLGEVATRLDRIDARIAALASAGPGADASEAIEAASDALEAARTATAAANQAMLVGAALGAGGVALGLVAIALALRAGRRGSPNA